MSQAAKPSSTAALARSNREAIIGLLRAHGTMSRPQLGERTGMAPATVNRLVADLMSRGLVQSVGRQSGTGGRPSMLVAMNDRSVVSAAVSVGPAVMRMGLYDLAGRALWQDELALAGTADASILVDEALRAADTVIREAAARDLRCPALGVSVPGVVDAEGRVDWAPALDWRSVPIGSLVADRTGASVAVENDANALALAEYHRGEAKGARGLVAVTLGDGIGAGVILDGSLLRGARAAAGEIGYMLVGADALSRHFPGYGDLEQRIGIDGITARARAEGVGGRDRMTVARVLAEAESGSPSALRLAGAVLDDLALALANVCVVLDPEVVVLGGDIGRFAGRMAPALAGRLTGRIPYVPEFIGPTFGEDATLIGVADLARDRAGSLLDLV